MKTEDNYDLKPVKPVKAVVAKRPSKKKPKDKPKRPLSAYNFFFKEEREKILKILLAEEGTKIENDPESDEYVPDDQIKRLRKEGGKVSFEEMGKIIGTRWKNIDPDRLNKYSELATEDTERYKKEMVEYNGRQEAKMRNESVRIANEAALKPSSGLVNRTDSRMDSRSQQLQQPYDTSSLGWGVSGAQGTLGYGVSGAQGVVNSAAYQAYMADYTGYNIPSMYGYGAYSMQQQQQGQGGLSSSVMSQQASEMGRMSGQQIQDPQSYGMYGGYQGGGTGYGGNQQQGNSQYDPSAMSPGDMQMYGAGGSSGGGSSYGHSNQGWGHQ